MIQSLSSREIDGRFGEHADVSRCGYEESKVQRFFFLALTSSVSRPTSAIVRVRTSTSN